MNWKTSSKALLLSSVALFIAGMGMTTALGPCYIPGAVVTEVAVGTAALSCLGLLVAALKRQLAWARLAGAAAGVCTMLFVGYWWTLMLCRGV